MSGPEDKAHAQVVEQWTSESGEKRYYVFWKTPSAYGSRGLGMTRDHAEHVAQHIRLHGPSAPISDYKPWIVLTPPKASTQASEGE